MTKEAGSPKTWGEITDAEKVELLLADHDGEDIERWDGIHHRWRAIHPGWKPEEAYRIKPEHKRETVAMGVRFYGSEWTVFKAIEDATHRITFETLDGEPDLSSIRMEKIND